MPHVAALQAALLSGGMALLPEGLAGAGDMERWHRDYRSGDPARRDVLMQELHATLRRALLGPLDFPRAPRARPEGARRVPGTQMAHVVAMVRQVMENLAEPMTNADVARVTGLNATYAMGLFTAVMGVPLRRFVIRMRLMRARALLLESDAPAAAVGAQAGFPSVSQFYAHFRAAYGTTPQALRAGR
jgi:AraC-like DNA-binding protein